MLPVLLVGYVLWRKSTRAGKSKDVLASMKDNRKAYLEHLAGLLYSDIKGVQINPWGRDANTWRIVASLVDDELIAFAAIFESKHSTVWNQSLYQAVKSERLGNVGQFRQIILNRLKTLNLT